MYRNTDKIIYKIYKKTMYDTKHRAVADAYTKSLDTLQTVAQTFSAEQWEAVKDYQQVFMNLHQSMMEIALHMKKA